MIRAALELRRNQVVVPFPSIKIGRVLGIDIEINFTWFVIFALVWLSLSFSYYPAIYPGHSRLANMVDGLITVFFFSMSVIAHELSHSLVARWNRVSIQKITLFIFGGIAQMSSEPKSGSVEFKMAVAGPVASFALSAFFYGWFLLLQIAGLNTAYTAPFKWLAVTNIILGLFNLLPGFPLDGGRVLRAVLWHYLKDFRRATKIAVRSGQGLAFILIAAGFGEIFFLRQFDGAWFIFLGWFLNYIASAYYRQVELEQSLAGIKVKEIMTADVLTVPPDLDLESLVNDYFLKYKFGRFPVVSAEELLGVIALHEIKEIPREKWSQTKVRDILMPLQSDLIVDPDEEAASALIQMARREVGHLLVVEEGVLVGIVTKSDIIRLIRVRAELSV